MASSTTDGLDGRESIASADLSALDQALLGVDAAALDFATPTDDSEYGDVGNGDRGAASGGDEPLSGPSEALGSPEGVGDGTADANRVAEHPGANLADDQAEAEDRSGEADDNLASSAESLDAVTLAPDPDHASEDAIATEATPTEPRDQPRPSPVDDDDDDDDGGGGDDGDDDDDGGGGNDGGGDGAGCSREDEDGNAVPTPPPMPGSPRPVATSIDGDGTASELLLGRLSRGATLSRRSMNKGRGARGGSAGAARLGRSSTSTAVTRANLLKSSFGTGGGRKQSRSETALTVAVDEVHSGWLTKRGRVRKSWKRRFCVLSAGRYEFTLRYYASSLAGGPPKGEIDLAGYLVADSAKCHETLENAFMLSADGQRDFFFEADSREEKAQWMTVLRLYTNLTASRRGRTDTADSLRSIDSAVSENGTRRPLSTLDDPYNLSLLCLRMMEVVPHTDELLVEVSRPPGGASNVYKLSIETSLPQYKRTSFGSQATLADLDSLYATLDRAYPRLLVPLPPSRLLAVLGRCSVDIADGDLFAVHDFMRRLTLHSTLNCCPELQNFLEGERGAFVPASSPVPPPRTMVDPRPESDAATGGGEGGGAAVENDWYVQLCNRLVTWDATIRAMEAGFTKYHTATLAHADGMRTFARNVAELIHFEEESPRCAVGRAFRATAAHLRQKASAGLVVFFCTLGGYMCAVDAAWRLLNVRTDILDSLDRERALHAKKTGQARKLRGSGKDAKAERVEDELAALADSIASLEAEIRACSQEVSTQLHHFEEQRLEDFYFAFAILVDLDVDGFARARSILATTCGEALALRADGLFPVPPTSGTGGSESSSSEGSESDTGAPGTSTT